MPDNIPDDLSSGDIFDAPEGPLVRALEPILELLIQIQQRIKTLETHSPTTQVISEELKQQHATLTQLMESTREPSPTQTDLLQELNTCNHSLHRINHRLQDQEDTLKSYLDWKTLAGLMLGTSVITAAIFLTALQWITPKQDKLLNTKLEIIFDRIEEIRTKK